MSVKGVLCVCVCDREDLCILNKCRTSVTVMYVLNMNECQD